MDAKQILEFVAKRESETLVCEDLIIEDILSMIENEGWILCLAPKGTICWYISPSKEEIVDFDHMRIGRIVFNE